MSESFTVATANTYYGALLGHPDGLQPFANRQTDVLLLQEVLNSSVSQLETSLDTHGFSLVNHDITAGLAIALNNGSGLEGTENRSIPLKALGKIGSFALRYDLPGAQRLRTRSVLSTTFENHRGTKFVAATSHPIVFARPLARRHQIQTMAAKLKTEYPERLPLVVGADMNHYPGPRKVDKLLAAQLKLNIAPVPESTWHIRGSKHEWLARIGSTVSGRPLESFDAQLDSILYRGLGLVALEVLDIASDHRALLGTFQLQ